MEYDLQDYPAALESAQVAAKVDPNSLLPLGMLALLCAATGIAKIGTS